MEKVNKNNNIYTNVIIIWYNILWSLNIKQFKLSNKHLTLIEFIQELIQLKNEIYSLIENCFLNNTLFQESRDKSFSHLLLNKDIISSKLNENYDLYLRVTIKNQTETQINKFITDIVDIFRYISNKLRFQADFLVRYRYYYLCLFNLFNF